MKRYQVTVRYGERPVRYHTFAVEAADIGEALATAARELPGEVRIRGDLVEVRPAPDPDGRAFLDGGEG